jgi:subtilase family serine protease
MKTYHYILSYVVLLSGCDNYPVKAPPGGYDLEATSVTIKPKEVFVGDGVTFTQTVTNKGKDAIPARSYEVTLYLENKSIAFDRDTSRIEPDMSIIYDMSDGKHHWVPTIPGTYKFRLVADEKNTLLETNEGNNEITGSIIVKDKNEGEQAAPSNP